MKKVIVLGGGFCGSVVAVNLTRLTEAPLDVTVINHQYPLGRGVAYSTRRTEHLLNVVARNMSALADQPDHFVDWLGTRSEFADMPATALRESFVPRRVYGDYLQSLFFWYARSYADGKKVRLRWIEAEATEVEPETERCHVWMADGQSLEADRVVLATGNVLPGQLPGGESGMPFYFPNPWSGWDNNLPDATKDVILVGTGLTMIDAFLTLMARGWQGKIFAISRNGLLPLSHFKGVNLGMGLRVTPEFVVLDAHRERSKYLMALGPLLKGTLWESTAVPELRNQAFHVAEFIIADMKHKRANVRTVPETYADVVEYSI